MRAKCGVEGWRRKYRQLYREGEEASMRVRRLIDGPIISPELHPSIGVNIRARR